MGVAEFARGYNLPDCFPSGKERINIVLMKEKGEEGDKEKEERMSGKRRGKQISRKKRN